MLNKLNELRKGKEEGFTLIELLVVILIIGVLSAIALPIFLNQQKESLKASVKSDVRNTVTQVATYIVSNPNAVGTDFAAISTGGVVSGTPNFDPVSSNGNTVEVAGVGTTQGAYTVTGTNGGLTGNYVFDSTTGQYTDNLG